MLPSGSGSITEVGKGGTTYEKYGGICLESHRPANAENVEGQPEYGDRIVRPDKNYEQNTVWKFTVPDGGSASTTTTTTHPDGTVVTTVTSSCGL